MSIVQQIAGAVVSGVIGGGITGVAAIAAIRVELKWLRTDVDRTARVLADHVREHSNAKT